MDIGALKPAISDRLMKRIAWRLAPLMIVMYIANQLDRANIGYAALTMNAELHMTAARFVPMVSAIRRPSSVASTTTSPRNST